jgi:hypothetical protein
MVTIGIVRSTGSLQGDQVLRGVYGQFTPGEVDGGVGKFQIAPEFKRISHLFALLDNGQSPVQPRDVHTIEVEDSQEHLVKAQLMHAMAGRWTKMYAGVAPSQAGLLGTMLQTESANVATAAKHHLISMGMRAFLVPVTCEMSTSMPGVHLSSERALLGSLGGPRNITVGEGDPVDLGTEVLGTRLQQPARDEVAPAADAAVATPQWGSSNFSYGVVAQVAGSVMVLATSPQQAREAVAIALRLQADSDATGMALELMPEAVMSVAPAPTESYIDGDSDDSDPDFDDDGDGFRDRG